MRNVVLPSPGVTKKQTRRKSGAQNFRSNGTKAYDSGVAGAATAPREKSAPPAVLHSHATPINDFVRLAGIGVNQQEFAC